MRREFTFRTSERVRWNTLRRRFPLDGPRGWSRSANLCAREMINVLEKDGTLTSDSMLDDLLLSLDSFVVGQVRMYGRSEAARKLREEANPFPAPDVLFRKLAPWWDTATSGGKADVPYRHVDEAFPDAKGFRERLIADGRREEAWNLQHELLAELLVDAFDRLGRELYGGDIVGACSVVSPDDTLPRFANAL